MTGYDISERVNMLLGYTDITLGDGHEKEILNAVNRIGFDLIGMESINSLNDELNINENIADAIVYGVCMIVTLTWSDSAKNALFTDIYNQKRASAKSSNAKIKDTIPTVSRG